MSKDKTEKELHKERVRLSVELRQKELDDELKRIANEEVL